MRHLTGMETRCFTASYRRTSVGRVPVATRLGRSVMMQHSNVAALDSENTETSLNTTERRKNLRIKQNWIFNQYENEITKADDDPAGHHSGDDCGSGGDTLPQILCPQLDRDVFRRFRQGGDMHWLPEGEVD